MTATSSMVGSTHPTGIENKVDSGDQVRLFIRPSHRYRTIADAHVAGLERGSLCRKPLSGNGADRTYKRPSASSITKPYEIFHAIRLLRSVLAVLIVFVFLDHTSTHISEVFD